VSGVGSTEPLNSVGAGFAGSEAGDSVGSTEPPRRRLDGAGLGAEVPASPAPKREMSGGAGFAGAGAGAGVGSTDPARRRLDGAGLGAEVPASPAPKREMSVGAGFAGAGAADIWSERAQLYVDSDAHRAGDDLDLLVTWARGARTALDVATGGGHVARRLRELGIEVVSCDPARGMHPDVVCRAEKLPFADASFDVVACRTAAHHFDDVRASVREMARVTRDRVLLVDTLNMGPECEQAEALRDPSHVRNYDEREWHEIVEWAGLAIDEVRMTTRTIDFSSWLRRTGCDGAAAMRVEQLWGDRVADGRLTLDKIAIKAVC
jgi:SAM-dependent methyltransferase